MAEKGFGVKEINLIGPSGTPTITSPNNLNLNANNVAISTNVSIGGTLTVTGNVSVGGTLTYEDVTNIDSVGIVTAAKGVRVNADSAFSGGALATNYISVGASQDLKLYHNGVINYIVANDARLILRADDIMLQSDDTSGRALYLDGGANRLELGYDGSAAAYITTSNVQFLKSITASADSTHDIGTNSVRFQNAYVDNYYGDGSNLTNLPISDIQVVYTVTANGSSAYRFAGNGVVSTADNPDLFLIRGQKYRFVNNSGGSHPFQIRESDGGTAYSTGVTNNGASSGNIDFEPRNDSPSYLVYQCTSHGGMVGNIYIRGAAGNNTNVGVTTFVGAVRQTGNPVFYAVMTTSSYTLTTTQTALVYNTAQVNVGNHYNTSNGRFTAPVTGLYEFGYTTIGSSAVDVYRFTLRVNGNEPYTARPQLRADNHTSGKYVTNAEFVCYVNMTAGQYAQVYGSSDGGNNGFSNDVTGYTYFRGRLIG